MIKGTEEYVDKVYGILEKGGILWLIERTDTNEFLIEKHNGLLESIQYKRDIWTKQLPTIGEMIFTYTIKYYYLTKKDAENHNHGFSEGGCQHCGHRSKQIRTTVTEHEFVKLTNIIRT